MNTHRTFAMVAAAAVALVMLSACAPNAAPEPSASGSASASATPSASPSGGAGEPSTDPDGGIVGDPGSWLITPAGIGEIAVGMDFDEAVALLPADHTMEACAAVWSGPEYTLTVAPAAGASTVGQVGVAAAPTLTAGPVGPRTADGLGLGSTVNDVAGVYPDAEIVSNGALGDHRHLRVPGAGGVGLFFTYTQGGDVIWAVDVTDLAAPPYTLCG